MDLLSALFAALSLDFLDRVDHITKGVGVHPRHQQVVCRFEGGANGMWEGSHEAILSFCVVNNTFYSFPVLPEHGLGAIHELIVDLVAHLQVHWSVSKPYKPCLVAKISTNKSDRSWSFDIALAGVVVAFLDWSNSSDGKEEACTSTSHMWHVGLWVGRHPEIKLVSILVVSLIAMVCLRGTPLAL